MLHFKLSRLTSPVAILALPLVLGATACSREAPAPSTQTTSQAAVGEDAALKGRLDAVLDRAITEGRIVGAVVFVARDGAVVYHRAAGLADRESGKPMREDTVFRLASMTKTVVSATALALVDTGKLGLDDPITKWLPEFRPKLADGREPVITVRHLLTHTSGLGYGFSEPEDGPYHRANVSDGLDQPGLSIAENLRRLASVPLLSEPGKAWRYSLSDDVLGEVIARAGGAPLPDVVRRTVTGPLGLEQTSFTVRDPATLATPYADSPPKPTRMAELHRVPFGPGVVRFAPGRALDPASYPSGGAGMVGTAGDYVKLLETLRTGGRPILRSETVDAMVRNQIGDLSVEPGIGWGFGVSVIKDGSHAPSAAGTWQWGGAYGHHWWVDPSARLTVVVSTNTTVEGMAGKLTQETRHAVYGR